MEVESELELEKAAGLSSGEGCFRQRDQLMPR